MAFVFISNLQHVSWGHLAVGSRVLTKVHLGQYLIKSLLKIWLKMVELDFPHQISGLTLSA